MADGNPFGFWLEGAMQRHGLTQAALARRVGVADTQVSRWRRGHVVPSVHHLQQLADTFGLSRTTLDPLAGYPPAEATLVAGTAANGDPVQQAETQAELHALQGWYGRLLAEKLPRALWQPYAQACEALAATLGAEFQELLARAQEETASDAPFAGAEERRRIGFQP